MSWRSVAGVPPSARQPLTLVKFGLPLNEPPRESHCNMTRLSMLPMVLIDGPRLADLMIEHGVGVSAVVSYEIKKIDSDYFDEE